MLRSRRLGFHSPCVLPLIAVRRCSPEHGDGALAPQMSCFTSDCRKALFTSPRPHLQFYRDLCFTSDCRKALFTTLVWNGDTKTYSVLPLIAVRRCSPWLYINPIHHPKGVLPLIAVRRCSLGGLRNIERQAPVFYL